LHNADFVRAQINRGDAATATAGTATVGIVGPRAGGNDVDNPAASVEVAGCIPRRPKGEQLCPNLFGAGGAAFAGACSQGADSKGKAAAILNVLIPLDVARLSGMISPTVPI